MSHMNKDLKYSYFLDVEAIIHLKDVQNRWKKDI